MKRCILCLQELPLFQGLDRAEFTSVCLSATKKRLAKNTFLFHQGDNAGTLFLVKTGKLKLVRVTDGGKEIILDIIGPGEVLGETALFHDQEYLFSAIALEETGLCCFNRHQFEALIQKNPGLAVKIISYLGQKLYKTLEHVAETSGTSTKEKLLRLLIRLAAEYGRKVPDGTLIELEITQQELADMVGASRVMTVQVLQQFTEAGIIERQGKHYVLKSDPCIDRFFA